MSNDDPNIPQNPHDPYGPPASGAPIPPPPGQPDHQGHRYGQQPGQQYGQPYGQPYAQAPAPGADIDVVEAFKYGWEKFKANLGVIVLGVLAFIAAIVVLYLIFFAIIMAAVSSGSSAAAGMGFFSIVLLAGFVMLLAVFMQASVVRVSLEISHGRPVTFASFFKFTNLGKVILTALLIGVASAIGAFVVVGSLAVGFFTQFALFYVIDKGLDPIEAIKASVNLILKNLTPSILLYVGVYLAYAVGAAVCGVGLLVSVPVALLATTFVYRRLNGEVITA